MILSYLRSGLAAALIGVAALPAMAQQGGVSASDVESLRKVVIKTRVQMHAIENSTRRQETALDLLYDERDAATSPDQARRLDDLIDRSIVSLDQTRAFEVEIAGRLTDLEGLIEMLMEDAPAKAREAEPTGSGEAVR